VLLGLLACGVATTEDDDVQDDAITDEEVVSAVDGRDCPPGSAATWQSFGQAFLLDHCVGCHSSQLPEGQRALAPVGVDFDTHELAMGWLDRIYARSADGNLTMPPVDAVSAEDRERLGDWLACGMP
jgi:uncharacterized membrane protein